MREILTLVLKEGDDNEVRLSLTFHKRMSAPETLIAFKDLSEAVMKSAFKFADSLGISREDSAKLFAMEGMQSEAIETYRRHYPEESEG